MLVLTGCIREDYSLCPPKTNVTLYFRLADETRGNVFLDNVFTTLTAIYREDGTFVEAIATTEEQYRVFPGIKINLEPGKYRVVGWGNTGIHTNDDSVRAGHPGDNAQVVYRFIGVDRTVGQGDVLYYAPIGGNPTGEYVMTVDENGHEGTLDFRPATRRIEVYVQGFDAGGADNPVVRLAGLPPGLTFTGMRRIEEAEPVTAELRSEMTTVDKDGKAGRFAFALFNVFSLRVADYDIRVDLLDPVSRETRFSTPLSAYITPEMDDPASTEPLRILIEFLGETDVRVTIPEWDLTDVGYGIFD